MKPPFLRIAGPYQAGTVSPLSVVAIEQYAHCMEKPPIIPGEALVPRLLAASQESDGEFRGLLLEAALTIATLRELVCIHRRVGLEYVEPQGNA